nr:carbohydrate kinase [Neobacillus sp. Marseille-Q6967]
MNKQGIISLGEPFVDYIATDSSNQNFQQWLGGATVNVAVGMRRLGIPSYYLCKLGTDEISEFVKHEFGRENVNIEYCVHSSVKKICGVYVHLNEQGERYFHSYINLTPSEVLTAEELKKEPFMRAKIFYFGSGTLFQETANMTTQMALKYAMEANAIVAFDTNLRLKRWESEEQCRKTVCSFLKNVDIVKLADDELLFLTQTNSVEEGLKKISTLNIPYVFVTMGNKGAWAVTNSEQIYVPGLEVKAIDTTGAGDAFMAALLYCFHEKGKPSDPSKLKEYTEYANHIGAAAVTKVGALTAFPKKTH